ncbi:hypothetical protein GLYMA_03G093900v4 [Glycine max]|uniref:BED-type domain-containing protein n=1 Tax=Glycine max TaxID=3847 RepID=A0A0R0KGL7_SOYBN|nr:hypothetical protein JHK85_007164 [Glycine max]KAH1069250.1 hypothetical protein GYH30_006735 [Glycine max]KRH66253.1 hypothetical protein GLYMA_03G093900v4 [Glycine max]
MSSPLEISEPIASTHTNDNEVNVQVPADSTQVEANNQENEHQEAVVGRKRKKTSVVWNDFDEMEISHGVKKAVCRYCKSKFATGGIGSSTTHLKRHSNSCIQKKAKTTAESRQPTIPFQPSNSNNPFMIPGVRYSNEKMREIIAIAIMVHEYPFSVVEDSIWMWAFQYANPDFHKITHKIARNDYMWKSNHQVVEYIVITGHFIDAGWNLQKRVLSFMKVPAPRCGIDVADAICKCLKTWGIENKVFSISMDNASYNDLCIRSLKENISLSMQDGLSTIKDIIFNIRESVKYINHNDARLKAFCDVVEQKRLKERKLVIDCPTRWNSTFNMLSNALKFKIAFASYKEREPYYNYAPSLEEWNQVVKVCKLLEVFNLATHVISEVWKVKQILDKEIEDEDLFMRKMVGPMKKKFDKYWGECNMLMAIISVLDPRGKFHMVSICFPLTYSKEVIDENIKKVKSSFEELYDEYVGLCLEESTSSVVNLDDNISSSSQFNTSVVTGFDEIMSMLHEKEVVSPIKSELKDYLDEGIYVPNTNSFSALDWWRNNNMKYRILSKMAVDILAIPISTVASESTFIAGGRVIDEFRSKLNEESVEALIYGGDWFRHKYNVKKKSKANITYYNFYK